MSNQAISILASEADPRVLAELNDDSKPLGFYGLADWQVIKVNSAFNFCFPIVQSTSLTGRLRLSIQTLPLV